MTERADAPLSGEARLRSRRRKLISFTTAGCVIVMIAVLATGQIGALYETGSIPAWAVIALWAVALIGYLWLNVSYLRRVDELDRQDNIIASVAALVFYVLAYPSWHMFHELGMVREPHSTALYLATLSAGFMVYIARKIGLR